jgi:hypothetical protein
MDADPRPERLGRLPFDALQPFDIVRFTAEHPGKRVDVGSKDG